MHCCALEIDIIILTQWLSIPSTAREYITFFVCIKCVQKYGYQLPYITIEIQQKNGYQSP